MKLLLITASSNEIKRIRKSRVIGFQQVTMPYLAAFVSHHWSVEHIDEDVDRVDVNTDADLVAITFHTPSANPVYELAAQFRQNGVPVVLGGPHVSLVPEEAARYADVIIVGEAEQLWPEFLNDFERGRHKKIYRKMPFPPLRIYR